MSSVWLFKIRFTVARGHVGLTIQSFFFFPPNNNVVFQNAMKRLVLRAGREKSVLQRHPWVFSGAIDTADQGIKLGEPVHICKHDGYPIAVASFSPQSQIRAKIWSFNSDTSIDKEFFRERIQSAWQARMKGIGIGNPQHGNSCRLVNSEGDGLPGIVVDKYGPYLVVQILSAGAHFFRSTILECLQELEGVEGIWERADKTMAELEGISPLEGKCWGDDVPDSFTLEEFGRKYVVDIKHGHKTGFYLDQRVNRSKVQQHTLAGDKVLNCFAYTGGFGIAAIQAGADSVINVETATGPRDIGLQNFQLNKLNDQQQFKYVDENAFQFLRTLKKEQKQFDVVIIDPPKLCFDKSGLSAATRAYKDINMSALQLLRPGGRMFTFSCSGLVPLELFSQIVFGAVRDTCIDVQTLEVLGQGTDHPFTPCFPEGWYLKGLLLRRPEI
jgi:23S rRNA (cytosine1962-C5)-methyltransferase